MICTTAVSNPSNFTNTVQAALKSQETWSHSALTSSGDVLAAMESGSEDVLGAVEEDQRGRKLPRLSPARHGQGGNLEPEACARAPGCCRARRRCFTARWVEEGMPHAGAFRPKACLGFFATLREKRSLCRRLCSTAAPPRVPVML
jgi:hypothetical protein